MYGILHNDIEAATNKRFGFADHVRVIKYRTLPSGVVVCLINSVTMSYYTPKGKARMKPVNRYMIYLLRARQGIPGYDHSTYDRSGNKGEMLKEFTKIKGA